MSENKTQNQHSSTPTAAPSREELHRNMQQSLGGGQRQPSQPLRRNNAPNNTRSVGDLANKQNANSRRRAASDKNRMAQERTAAEEKQEKMRRIKESMTAHDEENASSARRSRAPSSTAEEAQRYVQRQSAAGNNRRKRNIDDTYDYEVPRDYRQNQRRQAAQAAEAKKNRIGIILIAAFVMLILLAYIIGMLICSKGFLPNTYMNNVNIGGMTMDEATQTVIHEGEVQGLTFVKRGGEEIRFEGEEFGSAISLANDTAFQKAANQNVLFWFVNYISPAKYSTQLVNTYDEKMLAEMVRNHTWGTAPPTDAYLQKQPDGTYKIVPEDDGDMIDVEMLVEYTLEQVRNGKSTITLEDCDCYLTADKTAEDLGPALEEANSMMGLTITYDFVDRTEVLDSSVMADWVSSDSSGNVIVDQTAAESWVQTNIAAKYDTYVPGYTRTFHSTLQGTIELPLGAEGIYGWQTDVKATAEELVEYIKAGESVTIEPIYILEGFRRETDDIGNTYIEVDITNQHVWYYVDGSLFADSDCVTGMGSMPERNTPTGVFKVWTIEKNKTLVGEGYAAPVSYWLNFSWCDVGLHDLNRSAYGGDIYIYNGSHGCVNLPLDFAELLYNNVEINTPVLVIP